MLQRLRRRAGGFLLAPLGHKLVVQFSTYIAKVLLGQRAKVFMVFDKSLHSSVEQCISLLEA
jgi:hypothetical protein